MDFLGLSEYVGGKNESIYGRIKVLPSDFFVKELINDQIFSEEPLEKKRRMIDEEELGPAEAEEIEKNVGEIAAEIKQYILEGMDYFWYW